MSGAEEKKEEDVETKEDVEMTEKEKERKKKKEEEDALDNQKALNEEEIRLMKAYSFGPYDDDIKDLEKGVKKRLSDIEEAMGIKESDRGLAPPSQWDLNSDKVALQQEQPLLVARCTKIIERAGDGSSSSSSGAASAGTGGAVANPLAVDGGAAAAGGADSDEERQYMIVIRQIAKYVVDLGENVAPTDIEEAMRVGVDRSKYRIQIPLPPKIDASVTMMTVEEKPDVTYDDVGGCKEQIEKLREVVELPLLQPGKFVELGIDPPKGVLLYGPPGTGKTLCARAVANRTDATFIRVIGSELVQRYVGEGARMVRELFQMARSRKACIIFFDEIDAIGGARAGGDSFGDNEVQRTMLEIVNQLDGFDARGNIKVLMATNRPDTLDPALIRPGRLDRRIEFGLPDLEGRSKIFKIHASKMNCDRVIRWDLLARLCPNATGAEIRSVCTEAGMFAIRERKKMVTEKHFLKAVTKVIKEYKKFSSTPSYMVYN